MTVELGVSVSSRPVGERHVRSVADQERHVHDSRRARLNTVGGTRFDEYIDFQLQQLRSESNERCLTTLCRRTVIVTGYLLAVSFLDHWVIDGGFQSLDAADFDAVAPGRNGCTDWLAVIRPCLRRVNRLCATEEAR